MLMGLLGGGDKVGDASKQATAGTMGGLASLMSSLGGPSMTGMGNMPQQAGGGQQLNQEQMKAIFDLFGGHSNKIKVNPNPTGDWQNQMM